jgi:methionine-rich copper-binding protein CopC
MMFANPLRWFRRCLLVLAVAACSVALAGPAQAHDVLESSDPANGSSVPAVPGQIGLTFDHTPMGIGSVIQVQDETGTDQADGTVTIVDNHVSQAVKAGAPAGKYTVVWRVASSDGHPVEGTFTFTAGAGNSSAAPSAAATAAGSGGPQAGVVIAGGAAAVLVIAFAVVAVLVRRRLRSPESDA